MVRSCRHRSVISQICGLGHVLAQSSFRLKVLPKAAASLLPAVHVPLFLFPVHNRGHLELADHDNKLTGPDAVKFFERSGLPRPILAKVWALADSARKGYLDPSTFTKVCASYLACHCHQRDCRHCMNVYIACILCNMLSALTEASKIGLLVCMLRRHVMVSTCSPSTHHLYHQHRATSPFCSLLQQKLAECQQWHSSLP